MKNPSVFGSEFFFLILIPLRKTKKSICSSISYYLTIINLKIIMRKFLGPLDLLKTQVLHIYKLTEVIIVYEHQYFILTALEAVALSLKELNDGQKLNVMGLVPSFDRNHLSRKIFYQVLLRF